MSDRRTISTFYLAVAFLAGPGTLALPAQGTAQSIQGLVTDAAGVPVSGARLSIGNVATGLARSATSNDTGNYSFPLVEVGTYDIRCEKPGFSSQTVQGARLDAAGQIRQNFVLQPGGAAETVEASPSAVTLATESAAVFGVVENRRLIDLPLNGRNIVSLASVTPGVQFGERTGRGDGLGGLPIPGQSFSITANGQREIHQVFSIDGVDTKNPLTHSPNYVPSIEAIEEFKIQTNAYSAENGFAGGAVVNITMKSGTNDLHGALFEFLRNDALDAEDYFLNFERPASQPRAPKNRLRRNQFGALLAGPIIKNRTFWSANWESRRERIERVETAFFPPAAFRAGDFSALSRGTLNPATGRLFRPPLLIYDAFTGIPFTDNRIPPSLLHAGARRIMNQFLPPAEFQQADPLDFTARRGVNQPIDTNQYFLRLDHAATDRDRMFAHFAADRASAENQSINPNFPVFTSSQVTNMAAQWIHSFSQNWVNALRFGFNLSNDTLTTRHNTDSKFDIDSLGLGDFRVALDGNRKLTPREQGVPALGFTIGERISGNGLDRMRTYQLGDHMTRIQGRHELRMGGEVYRVSLDRAAANVAQGRLTFSAAESGYDFASFLMGLPSRAETPEGEPQTFPRATRFGVYLQDDWKATPKLTLNLGLRFDYNGNPRDVHGLWRTLDFQPTPTLFPDAVDPRGAVQLWSQDVRFFMPRLGLAYRPALKWVVRAGAGWFDNINPLDTWTILNLNPPKSGSLQFNSVTDLSRLLPVIAADGNIYQIRTRAYRAGLPVLTLGDPFLTQEGGTPVKRPVNLIHVKRDTKDGDVWKWSFDIQRELPSRAALTAAYVGAKGSHIGNSIDNWNDAPPSPDANFQAHRPWQQFFDPAQPQSGLQTLGDIRYLDSYGSSFHHALQVKLDKQYSRGLGFGLGYTWSKSHGDGENGGREAAQFQDARYNRRASRGRFRFDQTHNLVAHLAWELPGGNRRGPLKLLLGGWQGNAIVSIRSGFPFTITEAASDLNLGAGPARPDRIADGRRENAARALWFDPNAFRRATCNIPNRTDLCRYGNSGYNILSGPPQRNLDFSMFKNFTLKERFKLQLRAEFFNAFNTPFFGDPNGISFTTNDSIVPDGARMGEIRTLRTPLRVVQFGLKMIF